MINFIVSTIKRLIRWHRVKDTKVCNSESIASIDKPVEICYRQEAQPPTFLYSKESIDKLRSVYPKVVWKKDVTIEELAYNTGQQAIIDYIERQMKHGTPQRL